MREILFRGKPKKQGQYIFFSSIWQDFCGDGFVYGSLIVDKDKCFIVVTALCRQNSAINNGTTTMIEVIPETVGQYTGLTDKNGKKIFEGDIVKTQSFFDRPYSKTRKSKQFIGVVEYCIYTFNGNARYSKQSYKAEWRLKFIEDFGKYGHYYWSEFWDGEVIGNIHDNPELLKGE